MLPPGCVPCSACRPSCWPCWPCLARHNWGPRLWRAPWQTHFRTLTLLSFTPTTAYPAQSDPGLTRLQPVAAAAHVVPVLLTMVFMLPICTPPLGISRLILCCVDLSTADEGSVRLLRGLLLARERWHQTHHHPDGPSGQQEPVGAPGCRALRGAAGGPEQVGRETPSTGTTHGVRRPLPWAAHPRWPHSPAHGSLPVPDPERPVVTQLANI